MRKLTIKRHKSFVGCLGTMKVYIEDPMTNELMISGVPCRKLGTLKNGEEAEFMIENSAARIYVIADTLSKELCNECYQLQEGEEDVYLSGKNHYNPGAGNPFWFDGVTDPDVLAGRKKKSKTGIWVIIGAVIVGVVVGLLGSLSDLGALKDKNVEYKDFNMTLTGDFKKYPHEDFDFCYANEKYSVFGFNETFDDAASFTTDEYVQAFITANEIANATVTTKDGLVYTEYDSAVDADEIYHYWAFVFKNGDYFWVLTIASDKDSIAEAEPVAFNIAKTVTFDVAE